MKTSNKLLLSLATVALLTTGAYAKSCNQNMQCGMMGNTQQKQMGCMKKSHHKKGGHIIGAIMRLDLTPDQRAQINKILDDNRASQKRPSDAFSETKFDKKMFVQLAKEKKEGKIENKAQMIEKIYALLNDTQKKYLKVMLEMKKNQKGGGCGAKACNGRG